MGAAIQGLDLSKPLQSEDWSLITKAFKEYLVIFFPSQNLNPKSIENLMVKFGVPLAHPFFKSLPGSKFVHEIKKTPTEINSFGNVWHTDFTNLPKPSLANALYSIENPAQGGDTLFSNMYLSYETLSSGMKKMLSNLNAIHGFSERYKQTVENQESKLDTTKYDEDTIAYKESFSSEVVHPVIRTNPVNGKKALYVNPNFTLRFQGMSKEESAPILDFLYKHSTRPEITFRYSWNVGTLGIWDNRCTMHYAINDYFGYTRIMHRMVVMESEFPSS